MLIEGGRCCVILIVHNHPRPPTSSVLINIMVNTMRNIVQCEKHAQYRLQTGEFMSVLLTCSRMTMCSVQLVSLLLSCNCRIGSNETHYLWLVGVVITHGSDQNLCRWPASTSRSAQFIWSAFGRQQARLWQRGNSEHSSRRSLQFCLLGKAKCNAASFLVMIQLADWGGGGSSIDLCAARCSYATSLER